MRLSKIIGFLTFIIVGSIITGCQSTDEQDDSSFTEIVHINTDELASKMQNPGEDTIFIDVRETFEYEDGHIDGMINMPLSSLENTLEKLPVNSEIVIICRSGNRSMKAANMLQQNGYTKLVNVQGGISSWDGELVK
jgi:rhodanese-related sulfurtransferase